MTGYPETWVDSKGWQANLPPQAIYIHNMKEMDELQNRAVPACVASTLSLTWSSQLANSLYLVVEKSFHRVPGLLAPFLFPPDRSV